ncbi:MAG: DUF2149 domain-containing protein [Methanosphaera stadtmanae]|jgi:hypothetical protein|nr:DUF2149 domain-containing protein [Methanosphaera stadtmanae]
MTLRRRSRFTETEDTDPMSSATNLTDVMLVLAVGFMIFSFMAMGLQNITEVEERMEPTNQKMQNITSEGSGYTELGKVYEDPKTGEILMVQQNSSG